MIAAAEVSAPSAHAPPTFGRSKTALLEIFASHRRQALVWFLVAAAAWAWAAWDHHTLLAQLAQQRQVVVIDSLGTYYVSPLMPMEQAKELHALQTKLACKALFERNAAGLANPELFQLIFLRGAAEQAQREIAQATPEFHAKALHQMVEVGPPEILSTRNNTYYTTAEVQLIRVGTFQGAPITEVLRCRVRFTFLPNPDLTRNGRFPTAVAAFRVERITKS